MLYKSVMNIEDFIFLYQILGYETKWVILLSIYTEVYNCNELPGNPVTINFA